MSQAFGHAFEVIGKLVQNFEAHKEHYMGSSYQEAEARQDFIDKLFIALGWDVAHKHQTNPYKQEVKVEKNVRTKGAQRRADYAFSIAPNFRDIKFYVEAKKPSVEIASKSTYFQIIRYGWNSKTPIGVLTDFEQFHVVDCRYRPNINTAMDQKVEGLQYYYTDYLDKDKFAKIYWLFSREAVADNSIEDFAANLPKRRGKAVQKGFFRTGMQDIDESFLEDLDSFRADLAHMFKKADQSLDSLALTEMAQRAIDRLVFLRFLEDKWIETNYRISDFGNSGSCWRDFIAASRKLDAIYNGIVFKQHDLLDAADFHVDDSAFPDICEKLSHDHTPYDFNIIPIHILGSIYERFLGKVIVATDKRARVEEKPEVRKAGGVYYTPEYIVRYIVQNTIGKLIDGKHPNEIAKMRFADISCGSGSFLLGVYDYLLEYHCQWYNDNLKKPRKADCYKDEDGKLHLTLEKKREILLNNIYGVDIDHQAVEVTQLSLYLKLLEEETTATTQRFIVFNQLLPSLYNNIKCGNSLIGPDFYEQQELGLDDTETRRINVFDWESAFPEIFSSKNGGFDAVIGNPPYRRELDYKYLLDEIAATTFGKKYRSPRMDLWYYFVHRGLELLKLKGTLSFIINAYWTSGAGAEKLIKTLMMSHIDEIFFFRKLKVFKNVSGQHMVIRVTNSPSNRPTLIKLVNESSEKNAKSFVEGKASVKVYEKKKSQLFHGNKIDLEPPAEELLLKINCRVPLYELGKVRQGIAENPALINNKTNKKFGNRWHIGEGVFTLKPSELNRLNLPDAEQALLRPYHDLCDLGRYRIETIPSLSLIYSTRNTCPSIDAYPTIRDHLIRFKEIMDARRETLKGSNQWWHLHWPRDESLWQAQKILSIQMAKRPSFVPAVTACYVPFSVNVFVPSEQIGENINYITGLLNSNLLWLWYKHHAKRRGVGLEINGNVLSRTPIRRINFNNSSDKAIHDRIVKLVEQMLDLNKKLANAQTDADKNMYQSQVASTDRQIDKLVYALYALTDEEIAIVEEATQASA